jgi:hypothetical protein
MSKIMGIIMAITFMICNYVSECMLKPPIEVPTVLDVYSGLSVEDQDSLTVEQKANVAGMSVSEYSFFSSVVEAESDRKKGSIEGRVMIAIVILNRVDSKKFPNTITKVLRQRGQFAVVSSGAYRRVGRTKLSDRAVIEAVRRKKDGSAPAVLYFRAGYYFRGHKRYAKVGDNYFSY